MKIDIYSHILPERYLATLREKVPRDYEVREAANRANSDINLRLRLMDRYPDVLQVLSLSLPPLETVVTPEDAIELARIANDELAELLPSIQINL